MNRKRHWWLLKLGNVVAWYVVLIRVTAVDWRYEVEVRISSDGRRGRGRWV